MLSTHAQLRTKDRSMENVNSLNTFMGKTCSVVDSCRVTWGAHVVAGEGLWQERLGKFL